MIYTYQWIKIDEFSLPTDDINEILSSKANYVRAEVACEDIISAKKLTTNGFFFADRYLDARIDVEAQTELALRKRFTYQIFEGAESVKAYRKTCREIFSQAFTVDRRFYLKREFEKKEADVIINGYTERAINEGMPLILLRNKDDSAGALLLRDIETGYHIYLAGVKNKYKGTGAAMEMYAAAVDYCRGKSRRFLQGKISAANTAVMNIYITLGAMFFNPRDLYIMER